MAFNAALVGPMAACTFTDFGTSFDGVRGPKTRSRVRFSSKGFTSPNSESAKLTELSIGYSFWARRSFQDPGT